MKPQNDLFLLIKSLTKNEKRHFRMYTAAQGGNKVYLRLFDEILNQKNYDESGIKQKFSGERFINQLSAAKSYLYKLIIKSLVLYHTDDLVDAKISDAVLRAKILFKKALIPQYFKALERAKEIALKYERFGYLMEIYDMMRLIAKKEKMLKKFDKKIFTEAEDAITKLKNIFEYSSLLNKTFRISRTWGRSRHESVEKRIGNILKSPLMKNLSNARSLRAKEIYYNILETAAVVKADNNSLNKNTKSRYRLIELHPYPFEGHVINYKKDVLQNLLYNLAENNNYEKIGRFLEVYKSTFQNPDKIGEVADFSFYSGLLLDTYINTKNYTAGLVSVNQIESGIIQHKNKIDITSELSLQYKIVKLFILAGEFEKALERLNRLLLHPMLPIRADLECYCRILNLLVHFELGNTALLEHLIRSAYRFLYKKERLYRLETLILNFIRKIPLISSNDSLTFHLQLLKKEMLKLKKNPYEKKAFAYFDFIEWIDKRLTSNH